MKMFKVEINYCDLLYKGTLISISYNNMNENLDNTHIKHYNVVLLNERGEEKEFKFLNKEFIKII